MDLKNKNVKNGWAIKDSNGNMLVIGLVKENLINNWINRPYDRSPTWEECLDKGQSCVPVVLEEL